MHLKLTRAALGTALGAGLLVPVALAQAPAYAVDPLPNPPIEQSCGLDLSLVLDASGSVSSSHAVEDVRDAGDALLSALKNTNSTARVTQFASLSQVLASRIQIDDGSMADGGSLAEALQGYYNPIPPRPANVNIYSYRGSGSPQSSGSFTSANSSNQYTNWDQGMAQAGGAGAELVVFVTDGDPTGYDFDQPGDPFDPGPPPDVAVNTNRGAANQLTMDRAVQEANTVKAGNTRILTIGVGSALSNSDSVGRLQQISGPQVVRDADLANVDDLNQIDVALVTDFADLAAFMRSLVLQLCSPSLTVRKLAQTAGSATYAPEQGRDITVTPTVPGGDGFTWILPDTAPAASKTEPTDANGFAQFQWEPIPPEEDSAATVAESTSPDHTPGRPGAGNDYRCELKNEAGDVRVVADDFADPANPSFVLDPIGQEIVTCTIYNSFDYAPDIALDKVNAPTEVRGDLQPPATVTSSYTVTNPGNTPLSNVAVTDDRCGPVRPVPASGPNAGDTDADGLLDPGEAWQFTCTTPVRLTRSATAGGRNIVNTAVVAGIDPTGTQVTDTATADVDIFTPAITLDKTVNGEDAVTITDGQSVTYQYVATNVGNTPLGSVVLTDDPDCTPRTLVDDGDGDAILDLGESWTWTCEASPTEDVVNTADVTATPLNPLDANAPFPAPNPPVTDEDTASVTVVTVGVSLTKDADPTVVLLDPGPNPPAEAVTYTFEAENTGTAPVTRPGGASTKAPGWIADARCTSPATYQSGDADGDDLLDPDETWTFGCPGAVSVPTLNVASITGQPTDADGTPLDVDPVSDQARAFVDVRQPQLTVTKTALVPVVLDPDAAPLEGPDVPAPRPAEYRYEVANPGDVPLALDPAPVDDKCSPLTFVEGDTLENPGLLDPDEVWVYTCTTTLERQDAEPPPGDRSGQVENTITVVGIPLLDGVRRPDKQVTGSDTATVQVIEPGLALTKTASATVVRNGSDVTYTVTVQNTGTSELKLDGPTDDKCAPLRFVSGDTDDDDLLDGADTSAETWTFTCTRTIDVVDATGVDTNVASVTGVDQLGNSYEDSDEATVRVISPAIELTKTPSATLVPAGSDVTYTFEVRNVGTSDLPAEDVLDNVVLVDLARPPLGPDCTAPDLVEKQGGNQDDVLERDPPEVWIYQCTSPILRPTTNVGVVGAIGGRPVDLEFPVEDWDAAQVQPFHPGIDIEKTASPTRLEGGGEVTYTYRVTNTGDVPLAGVADTISDDTCAPVEYVSGDRDGDGLLDTPDSIFEDRADETWVFTCTTRVEEDTTNVVIVTGSPTDQSGNPLCGPDAAPERVRTSCDVRATDRARVVVTAPGTGPSSGGQVPGAGPSSLLPDTGAPSGLRELLALGIALLLAGALLVAGSRRRDAGPG